ncbi:hypothetical protein [Neobacillus mesonae]|nr:hypothetical protein [Neobacillus mesonae]MCM3567137.1 hypothetical protein [Neobacillus mesonae]
METEDGVNPGEQSLMSGHGDKTWWKPEETVFNKASWGQNLVETKRNCH